MLDKKLVDTTSNQLNEIFEQSQKLVKKHYQRGDTRFIDTQGYRISCMAYMKMLVELVKINIEFPGIEVAKNLVEKNVRAAPPPIGPEPKTPEPEKKMFPVDLPQEMLNNLECYWEQGHIIIKAKKWLTDWTEYHNKLASQGFAWVKNGNKGYWDKEEGH